MTNVSKNLNTIEEVKGYKKNNKKNNHIFNFYNPRMSSIYLYYRNNWFKNILWFIWKFPLLHLCSRQRQQIWIKHKWRLSNYTKINTSWFYNKREWFNYLL